MNEEKARAIFEKDKAVLQGTHVVYASTRHGSEYVNKDAVYPHTHDVSALCQSLAEHFQLLGVQTVIGPIIGAVSLSQWTAYHLSELTRTEVFSVYSEHDDQSLVKADATKQIVVPGVGDILLLPGEELFIRKAGFVIKRGYDKFIAGHRVLVVEDVLTTGGSVKKVVEAVRLAGGEVLGVAALVNRGRVTAADVGDVPVLVSVLNIDMDSWSKDECPLCTAGVPINTDVGKGKAFLDSKAKEAK